tara:strand:- start:5197 stop:5973 length:777 start_codon:yes stop_codon:yes gene_type:complete
MNYQGIEDIEAYAENPVQAVLTIGTKGPSGVPTKTDHFFIKSTNTESVQTGKRTILKRENHPQFDRFNNSKNPELRNNIFFKIVAPIHLRDGWQSMEESLKFYLKAQQIDMPRHPNNAPHCTGNGKTASRWNPKENKYDTIECPNRTCKYRQDNAECKPFIQLFGQLNWEKDKPWSELPQPLIKWESRSWYNLTKVLLPFFRGIHNQAIALGYGDNYSLQGLIVKMSLHKRKSARGSNVPAISLSLVSNLDLHLRDQN